MSVEPILAEAQRLVYGARNGAYGPPADNFERTVQMINAMLKHKLRVPLAAEDFAYIMICCKLARQVMKHSRDNLTDLAGYAEAAARIREYPDDLGL